MTTSGTTGTTTFDVISIIEKASRRCGVLPGVLTAELLQDASQELSLSLMSLVNEGVPLWTVDKQIYGLTLDQNILQFSADTVDLQNVLYRFNVPESGGTPASSAGGVAANAFDQSLTTVCTQTAPNGNLSYHFATPTVVVTAGILMNTTRTLNPIFEYSNDGITWSTAIPAASTASSYSAGQWYWKDVAAPQSASYFRVRETSGGTLDVIQVVFGLKANEILISRINKDDYQNLPYKNQRGRVLQYWVDRQIIPQAWLWPASMYWLDSLVVWRRRVLQDVGSYTNTIEFPARWLDAIVDDLASRIICTLPMADLNRAPRLENKALKSKNLAWQEERDASPVYMTPLIGAYTRGR